MILDSLNQFSDAQAFSASGASTNLIDLGAARGIADGEPMVLAITVDVAADFTTTDETYAFALQTDDNSSFLSASTIVTRTILAAALTAKSKHYIPVPPGVTPERYLRMYATLGGTTPSVTVTAELQPRSMIQNERVYASGYSIS